MSEAKDRILQAGIEEFGKHGYKNASTNRIMAAAEVSKGLIFHHYGSKENLYMACTRYVVDLYTNAFEESCDLAEKDFYKRYENIVAFKVRFLIENPFLGKMLAETGKTYIEKTIPELNRYTETMYKKRWDILTQGVDTSKYRENIPAETVHEFILAVMDGYGNRYHFEKMSYEEMLESLGGYFKHMEMMKDIIFYGIYERNKVNRKTKFIEVKNNSKVKQPGTTPIGK